MLEEKIDALNRIYELYDRYTKTLTLACRKYCAHCCTCNVTLTSLEAANIFRSLSPARRAEIRRAVEPQISRKRYQPEITLNQMARCCINGEKLPDEQIDPAWGPCPLL